MQSAVQKILSTSSSFGNETGELTCGNFEPGEETISFIEETARILVIGAGGLGCEILKNLAYSGFKQIEVIDLDTIDVTNLNRQFLFRQKDVGRKKAEVAAEFINRKVPGVSIIPHCCPIQEKNDDFYLQFSLIIAGLDNIQARRWLNSMLHQLAQSERGIIPLIDGGTEAFKGQARVIIPGMTSCFECSIESFPPQVHFPLCTVAETPRKPDHCIAYVLFAVNKALSNPEADKLHEDFVQKFGKDVALDKDDPHHMKFIFENALERAEKYNIEGVTYMLTLGVVKNIVPAVASINAIIAAACVNEVFKILSWCRRTLNNYFMYNGTSGVYSYTFEYEKKAECPVCCANDIPRTIDPETTLEAFIASLVDDSSLQLTKPSIRTDKLSLYVQNPESLREQTSLNLPKPMKDLVCEGDVLSITDPIFPIGVAIYIVISFKA